MLEEQKETVRIFRESFSQDSMERFVIYGTGINAEAVVKSCGDYPIVGLMDASKTGQSFWGKKVLSEDEILNLDIRLVVVIARPAVHNIIYKRIRKWSEEAEISVLDIQGNKIADKVRVQECNSEYLEVSFDALLREIDCHDVISFDVFDTLLMRKVYEPADVFELMDRDFLDRFPFVFSKERKAAEQELRKKNEPTIYQIYEYLAEKNHLSEEEEQYLLMSELKKEGDVLCVREKMKYCMEYCIRQGKKVYLVSDMYLPAEVLGKLLDQQGITGYIELLVSCDYQTSKLENLFEQLKEKAEGEKYLHIGDNQEADYDSPKKHGMDAFLIMSAVRMMECSTYRDACIYLGSLSSRVMVGMLAAEMFRDPFVLNGTKGKPTIVDAEQFGYTLISPLVVSFTVWMYHKIYAGKKSLLLFSARDGWIFQKVFRYFAKEWRLDGLPEDLYFMVSRRALEIVDKGEDREAQEKYQAYLKTLDFASYDSVFYFDFMSRGTCQSLLENISGQKMQGIYFQKSVSGVVSKDAVQVWPYFEENSAHEKDLRIFALCDFLECIFTSYDPSFQKINEDGSYLYEEEKRTKEQIGILKKIHAGIFRYCKDFVRIMPNLPEDMPPKEYSDEILRYTSAEYSRIKIPELKEFMLDDWLGGDKNTGRDALM